MDERRAPQEPPVHKFGFIDPKTGKGPHGGKMYGVEPKDAKELPVALDRVDKLGGASQKKPGIVKRILNTMFISEEVLGLAADIDITPLEEDFSEFSEDRLDEFIRKEGGLYVVRSHQTGKVFGRYKSKGKAEHRLRQMAHFRK